jgi:ubiquinone/menaquinone biosynthesis C-methylase UbiE
LRFEDKVCDFIISSGVLHSLKNPSAAIREWLRVLKPGHELWIYDPTVLIAEDEAKDYCRLDKIFEDMEKSLTTRKDRLIFRLMRWISNLPPHPMSLERIYEIVQDVGVVELISVKDKRDYVKIEIIKK